MKSILVTSNTIKYYPWENNYQYVKVDEWELRKMDFCNKKLKYILYLYTNNKMSVKKIRRA